VARPCECRDRRVARNRARGVASVIPAKYRGVSFERPPVTSMDRMLVRLVHTFCDEIDANLDRGRGLWLIGDVGTGKTTLAMLVSKAALEAGRSVAIYSLPKLLARVRRTYDAERGEQSYLDFFERLGSVDLLHIDDLGAEKRSDWVLEQLYALINERYEAGRSILITSNTEAEDGGDIERAQARLAREINPRTVSRLLEICELVPMFGEDNRMQLAS
jgi:DNA replication protein DnaC